MPKGKPRCPHRKEPTLGYHQFFADCEKRTKAGQRQIWCNVCGQYVWSEYWRSVQVKLASGMAAQ